MASATLECVCCGRKGFKSERGLTQHQNQNLPCREHMLLKSRGKTVSTSFHAVFKYVPVNASNSQQKSDQLLAKNGSTYVNSSPSKHQMASALDPVDAKRQRMAMNSAETAITTQQIAANGNSSDNDSESGSNDDSTADDFGSAGGDDEETVQMDTSMLEALNNYIALRRSSSVQLTQSQMSSIRLLLRLRNTKASLNTYDSVMTWHLEDTGKKRVDETLGQCKDFISRHKVYKALNSRYSFSQEYMPCRENSTTTSNLYGLHWQQYWRQRSQFLGAPITALA